MMVAATLIVFFLFCCFIIQNIWFIWFIMDNIYPEPSFLRNYSRKKCSLFLWIGHLATLTVCVCAWVFLFSPKKMFWSFFQIYFCSYCWLFCCFLVFHFVKLVKSSKNRNRNKKKICKYIFGPYLFIQMWFFKLITFFLVAVHGTIHLDKEHNKIYLVFLILGKFNVFWIHSFQLFTCNLNQYCLLNVNKHVVVFGLTFVVVVVEYDILQTNVNLI